MLDPRLVQLAHNIRNAIAQSPFSASDVARSLGVDRSTVTRWTTGERTPTMENLLKLSDLLDRKAEDMWSGPEAIPTTPEQRLAIDYMGRMTPAQQEAYLALAATIADKK